MVKFETFADVVASNTDVTNISPRLLRSIQSLRIDPDSLKEVQSFSRLVAVDSEYGPRSSTNLIDIVEDRRLSSADAQPQLGVKIKPSVRQVKKETLRLYFTGVVLIVVTRMDAGRFYDFLFDVARGEWTGAMLTPLDESYAIRVDYFKLRRAGSGREIPNSAVFVSPPWDSVNSRWELPAAFLVNAGNRWARKWSHKLRPNLKACTELLFGDDGLPKQVVYLTNARDIDHNTRLSWLYESRDDSGRFLDLTHPAY